MADKRIGVLLIGAEIEENLAIRYLGACLAVRGHAAAIVHCCSSQDFANVLTEIRRKHPEIIAISMAFQSQAAMHLDLAAEIRRQGFTGHLIVGGHFPTFEYQTILEQHPAVDSVGRFDGEETIVALADVIASGGDLTAVPNLVYRVQGNLWATPCRNAFPDLDALPFPLRTTPPRKRFGENIASIAASRGCWHSACLYCCIGAFHKPKNASFSLRSPENVAREIAELFDQHGIRIFQFQDDNFTLATKDLTLARFESLAKALRAAGIDTQKLAFFIKARPDAIDEQIAGALRDLGCASVFLGIENASKTGLAALIRAAGIDHIEEAIRALRTREIAVNYNLLVFYPKATVEEYRANIDFVAAHPDLPFDLGRAEIVAGSRLEKDIRARGLLRGSWPWWDYVLLDPVMNRMCDVFRLALRPPDSPYGPTTFQMIDIVQHAAVVAKLCPGISAQSFAQEAAAIVRTWNQTILHAMRQICALAEEDDPKPGISHLQADIDTGARTTRQHVEELRAALTNYQRTHKTFQRFGVEDALDGNTLLRKLFKY